MLDAPTPRRQISRESTRDRSFFGQIDVRDPSRNQSRKSSREIKDGAACGSFHDLVQQLVRAHENCIAELSEENARLREHSTPGIRRSGKVAARSCSGLEKHIEEVSTDNSQPPLGKSSVVQLGELLPMATTSENPNTERHLDTLDECPEAEPYSSLDPILMEGDDWTVAGSTPALQKKASQTSQPGVQSTLLDATKRQDSSLSGRPSHSNSVVRVHGETPVIHTSVHHFSLQKVWAENSNKVTDNHRQSMSITRSTTSKVLFMKQATDQNYLRGNSCLQPYIWHPHSFKRMFWDVISMSLLGYDIVVIPFKGAFDPDMPTFFTVMSWLILFFWTADIMVSSVTGYQVGRLTVMQPKKIVGHYLRTWFCLDIVLVGFDWSLALLSDAASGSAARLGRSLRFLRFVRTLRLIRILKLKRIIQEIQDRINTEAVSIVFGVFKIIICLFIFTHLIACGWFAIGSLHRNDPMPTWVKENSMMQASKAYQYTTSLHWSLTQFTPASMEVYPENQDERLFAVIVLFFAMITFSSFISLLTASMTRLNNLRNDESRQFWLLRRYLRDWGVSYTVASRVQRYLEFAYQKQRQRVQDRDVNLLSLLSDPLREELKHEIFSTHIAGHPLLGQCSERAFNRALVSSSMARGDVLFACGENAINMVFVSSGSFEYALGDVHSEDDDVGTPLVGKISSMTLHGEEQQAEYVTEGQWVAEPVLWTNWMHLGDLVAVSECQAMLPGLRKTRYSAFCVRDAYHGGDTIKLDFEASMKAILLDAHRFGEAVCVSRPMWSALREYARMYIDALNKVNKEELTDLSQKMISPRSVLDASNFIEVHGHQLARQKTGASTDPTIAERHVTPMQVYRRRLRKYFLKQIGQWKLDR